jgi:tetratricopeptide (TPR) repeat protein
LDDLAWSLYYDNQLDAAENVAYRAIDLVLEKGQEHLLCNTHRVLGSVHGSKGEKEKAIHHFKSALEIASHFNWHDVLVSNHHDLAGLFLEEGEFDEASAHIEQAKPHAINDPFGLGCAIYMQAKVWYRQCKFEDAKSEASHALEIFEKLGAKDAEGPRDLLQKIERAM